MNDIVTLVVAIAALAVSGWSAWNSHRAATASVEAVRLSDRSVAAAERSAVAAENSAQLAERATELDVEMLEIERQRRSEELANASQKGKDPLRASPPRLGLVLTLAPSTYLAPAMVFQAARHKVPFYLVVTNLDNSLVIEKIDIKLLSFKSGNDTARLTKVIFDSGSGERRASVLNLAPREKRQVLMRSDRLDLPGSITIKIRCDVGFGKVFEFEREVGAA